jgi:hypothetical protein
VRLLSLARTLFALLAFQLALGMQVGVAYASTISPSLAPTHQSSAAHESSANAGDEACPTHNAIASSSHTSAHVKAPPAKSADKHDCCKASGCQCQCGNVPLAFNVSAIRGASATAVVQPIRVTRVAAAPTDTHFRPPIAS